MGYTSTSQDSKVAYHFALKEPKPDTVAVVFEIEFNGDKGLFKLCGGYSAYPEETEVLIQDGLQYQVTGHDEKCATDSDLMYHMI